jgi:N-acetylglucosamine-6-sulfatase
MRGQYSHNTHIWKNAYSSIGSWETYRDRGYQRDDLATRLHGAGYRTALIGKYMNNYRGTSVPAGWDKWFATVEPSPYNYFDYYINSDGTMRHYGSARNDYKTDVLSRQAQGFIASSASRGTPFFAYVAPTAPHKPASPAPRDAHTYDGLRGPRLPSFNERDVSDKPSWIRQLPRIGAHRIGEMDHLSEKRAESLQAVDDLVAGVVGTLNEAGAMSNTYIFFTSDNGYFRGEHRIPAEKSLPYEEVTRMPLLVRGPGIPAGGYTKKLALNTDYLPTFTDLAGAPPPPYADGRSLVPVLGGSATTWRTAILLEGAGSKGGSKPPYRAIRTRGTTQRKYVEYVGSPAGELYDLQADPYERFSKSARPAGLVSRLRALKTCAREGCRTAEN